MTKKTKNKEKTDSKKSEKLTKVKVEITVQEELDKVYLDLKNQKDKLLRCYADFDNYKKRVEKEKKSNEHKIKKLYLSEILDIKELFLQVLNDENPKEGLRILSNKLEQFFESEKIKYIECIGKSFNHEMHHAVSTIEMNDTEDNIVIEEIKKGYLVEDLVLRPSHVIVSKKKCEEEEINE